MDIRSKRALAFGITLIMHLPCDGGDCVAFEFVDRQYCRTNTWNGCCVYENGRGTRFWKWDSPRGEIVSAIYAARHYIRYGKASLTSSGYYEDTVTLHDGRAWRLNLNQFPPPTSNDIAIDGMSVLLSDMDICVLPFEVTNPGSKSPLRCILVEFLHKGRFCFAVYVNVNTGRASLDFHEFTDSGWMLIASESRYPYLTPPECEIQSQFYIKHFRKDDKTGQPPPSRPVFDSGRDIDVAI